VRCLALPALRQHVALALDLVIVALALTLRFVALTLEVVVLALSLALTPASSLISLRSAQLALWRIDRCDDSNAACRYHFCSLATFFSLFDGDM